MMTVFHSTEANPSVASDDWTEKKFGDQKIVKNVLFMVILDGHRRLEAVCELKVEGGYAWSEQKFCIKENNASRRQGNQACGGDLAE